MKKGIIEKIMIRVAALVPVLFLNRKNKGSPTKRAMKKQISCRLVRLKTTFVLTLLKSFGTGT
jgi:hypothetical protein